MIARFLQDAGQRAEPVADRRIDAVVAEPPGELEVGEVVARLRSEQRAEGEGRIFGGLNLFKDDRFLHQFAGVPEQAGEAVFIEVAVFGALQIDEDQIFAGEGGDVVAVRNVPLDAVTDIIRPGHRRFPVGQGAIDPEVERFAGRRRQRDQQNQRGGSGESADFPRSPARGVPVQESDGGGGGREVEHGGDRRPFIAGHAVTQCVEREVEGEFIAEGFAADHPGAAFGDGGEEKEEHDPAGEGGAPPFPRGREKGSGEGDRPRADDRGDHRPEAAVEKFGGEEGADDAGRQEEQQRGEECGESHTVFSLFFGTGT